MRFLEFFQLILVFFNDLNFNDYFKFQWILQWFSRGHFLQKPCTFTVKTNISMIFRAPNFNANFNELFFHFSETWRFFKRNTIFYILLVWKLIFLFSKPVSSVFFAFVRETIMKCNVCCLLSTVSSWNSLDFTWKTHFCVIFSRFKYFFDIFTEICIIFAFVADFSWFRLQMLAGHQNSPVAPQFRTPHQALKGIRGPFRVIIRPSRAL